MAAKLDRMFPVTNDQGAKLAAAGRREMLNEILNGMPTILREETEKELQTQGVSIDSISMAVDSKSPIPPSEGRAMSVDGEISRSQTSRKPKPLQPRLTSTPSRPHHPTPQQAPSTTSDTQDGMGSSTSLVLPTASSLTPRFATPPRIPVQNLEYIRSQGAPSPASPAVLRPSGVKVLVNGSTPRSV